MSAGPKSLDQDILLALTFLFASIQFQGSTLIIEIIFGSTSRVKCVIFTMSIFHNIPKFPSTFSSPCKPRL